MFKKELPPSRLDFESVKIAVELGYQGIKKDYSSARHIFIPNKKSQKSKKNPNTFFTRKKKAQNKIMASKRVIVEHAIASVGWVNCSERRVTAIKLRKFLVCKIFKLLYI